jgi:hypothetical protein
MDDSRIFVAPIAAMAVAALIAAVWGGLGRMGLVTMAPPAKLAMSHGALIANGFFGTVISLERAVALDRAAVYVIPGVAGLGTWLSYFGWPLFGSLGVVVASIGLVGVFGWLTWREPARHHVIMGLGALAWAVAATLLVLHVSGTGISMGGLAPWWAAFLVLTIAGERLELARVLRPDRFSQACFLASVISVLGGLILQLAGFSFGFQITGVGFVGLALWLGIYDVARRTAKQEGLPGYIGRTLLGGYVWLAIGGVLLVFHGPTTGGLVFDAQWHAIFVGFVLTMIFAHAPVVLRALADRRIPYHPTLYVAPALIHVTLAVRMYGDLAVDPTWRLAGGLGNAAAILVFVASAIPRIERT